MARRAHRRKSGFWRGVATGMLLAVLAALALAIAYPSFQFMPPEVAEGVVSAPEDPPQPGTVGVSAPAGAGGPGAARGAMPLIEGRPAADAPPALSDLAPPPAPDVFDGGPAGSPSLVPPEAR